MGGGAKKHLGMQDFFCNHYNCSQYEIKVYDYFSTTHYFVWRQSQHILESSWRVAQFDPLWSNGCKRADCSKNKPMMCEKNTAGYRNKYEGC